MASGLWNKPRPLLTCGCSSCLQISHMEMIKGIQGHGYYDELVVPIIENTAREYELTDSLAAAVRANVSASCALVCGLCLVSVRASC